MNKDSSIVISRAVFSGLLALFLATSCGSENGSPVARPDYMIIAADGLTGEAEAIRAYREGTGHDAELFTMSEIIAGMEGGEIEDELKARIRSGYEERDPGRPFFVLLVGDAGEVTTEDPGLIPAPVVNISGSTIVSDNWYADMDGDSIPDLAIGRLPFRESAEVEFYLEKLKAYEGKYLPGEWNRRISFFAGTAGFGDTIDATIEAMAVEIIDRLPYTYDVNMTYASEASPYFYVPAEFSEKVYARFNEGALAMTYIGHGNVDRLDQVVEEPILDTADLGKLDPEGRAPILTIIACLTGKFNYSADSLSEMILKGDNGIVAVFSSSEISDPGVNAIIAMEMEEGIYIAQPETLGEGLMAVKDNVVNREGDEVHNLIMEFIMFFEDVTEEQAEEMLVHHIYMYNLFGDPALVIPYPRGEAFLTLDKQEYRAGETVSIAGTAAGVSGGKAIVSLEVPRPELAYPIKSDPTTDEEIRTNYANANNKVLVSAEADVVSGAFNASLNLSGELKTGTYHIKVYAASADTDAVGCTTLELVP